jgi:hypothetical protein
MGASLSAHHSLVGPVGERHQHAQGLLKPSRRRSQRLAADNDLQSFAGPDTKDEKLVVVGSRALRGQRDVRIEGADLGHAPLELREGDEVQHRHGARREDEGAGDGAEGRGFSRQLRGGRSLDSMGHVETAGGHRGEQLGAREAVASSKRIRAGP